MISCLLPAGSTLEAMALAVEKAAVVLVCMSQRYKDSPSCRTGKMKSLDATMSNGELFITHMQTNQQFTMKYNINFTGYKPTRAVTPLK